MDEPLRVHTAEQLASVVRNAAAVLAPDKSARVEPWLVSGPGRDPVWKTDFQIFRADRPRGEFSGVLVEFQLATCSVYRQVSTPGTAIREARREKAPYAVWVTRFPDEPLSDLAPERWLEEILSQMEKLPPARERSPECSQGSGG